MATTATIWRRDPEQVWIVSVKTPRDYEQDLGEFDYAYDAIGHLSRWADQRGMVALPAGPWLEHGTNEFNILPIIKEDHG